MCDNRFFPSTRTIQPNSVTGVYNDMQVAVDNIKATTGNIKDIVCTTINGQAPGTAPSLATLGDVSFSALTNDDIIKYDGNTLLWVNQQAPWVSSNYLFNAINNDFLYKQKVDYATTVPLTDASTNINTITYSSYNTINGTYVGTLVIDGVAVPNGKRILIKHELDGRYNGIYDLNHFTGSFSLIRTTDANIYSHLLQGVIVPVLFGNQNANTLWQQSSFVNQPLDAYSLNFVKVGGSSITALSALTDTNITTPSNNQVLKYNTTSSKWENSTQSAVITSHTGLTDIGTNTHAQIDSHISATSAHGVSGNIVGTTDSQTLTNKTLTAPVISTISNTGTLTLPTSTDTLVGRSTVDTLSNKTLGSNLDVNNNYLIHCPNPINGDDVANKQYVDGLISGLDIKQSCRVATTVDLASVPSIQAISVTYNNTGGTSGRGQITATLQVSNTLTIDGVSVVNNNRILIKNQTAQDQNGVYVVTISGTSLTLDRTTDFDQDSEVTAGLFTFIEEGTVNNDSGWVLATNNPIVIGGASGSNLLFTQFSGAGQVTAGDGITKTGNVISTNLKPNGGLVIETGTLAVDLSASSITGTLAITDGGTGVSTFSNGNYFVNTNSGNNGLETTKAMPSGAVVGTTDTQTLTNKTIDDATNTVKADKIKAVVISATSATANQKLKTTDAINASWVDDRLDLLNDVNVLNDNINHAFIESQSSYINRFINRYVKFNPWIDYLRITGTSTNYGTLITDANNWDTLRKTDNLNLQLSNTLLMTSGWTFYYVGKNNSKSANPIHPSLASAESTMINFTNNSIQIGLQTSLSINLDSTNTQVKFVCGGTDSAGTRFGVGTPPTSVFNTHILIMTYDSINNLLKVYWNNTQIMNLNINLTSSVNPTTYIRMSGANSIYFANSMDLLEVGITQTLYDATAVTNLYNNLLPYLSTKILVNSVTNNQILRYSTASSNKWINADCPNVICGTTDTQTLTNKTLVSPIINNGGILTLPTTADTLVGRTTTDTLTNKTLTAPVISTISNSGTITIPTGSDTLVGKATTDVLTNKTFTDATTFFQDDITNTKKMQFQLSGITASNTRTLTVPDANTTILGTDATQTITNKTIDDATNVVRADKIKAVVISGTAPTTGQVIKATGTTTALWQDENCKVVGTRLTVITPGGTGNELIAIGSNCCPNVSGIANTCIGSNCMSNLTTGVNNLAYGSYAGNAVTSGQGNTVIGTAAMFASNVAGSFNTCLGNEAGRTCRDNNTCLGSFAGRNLSATSDNNIVIGQNQANGYGSNNILIGVDTVHTNTQIYGILGQTATGNFVTINSSSKLGSVVAPSGTLVGTTDTQTLTNKTIDDTSNIVRATKIRNVVVNATIPSANQRLKTSDLNNCAWVDDTLINCNDVTQTETLVGHLLFWDSASSKYYSKRYLYAQMFTSAGTTSPMPSGTTGLINDLNFNPLTMTCNNNIGLELFSPSSGVYGLKTPFFSPFTKLQLLVHVEITYQIDHATDDIEFYILEGGNTTHTSKNTIYNANRNQQQNFSTILTTTQDMNISLKWAITNHANKNLTISNFKMIVSQLMYSY